MMRETQIIGLPGEAQKFLNDNVVMIPDVTCPKCGEVITTRMKFEEWKSEERLGMFDDGPRLLRYYLKDGTTVEEHVQSSPWSSGPCIFLMLKRGNDVLFDWSEDEINRAISPEELPEICCRIEEDI